MKREAVASVPPHFEIEEPSACVLAVCVYVPVHPLVAVAVSSVELVQSLSPAQILQPIRKEPRNHGHGRRYAGDVRRRLDSPVPSRHV